MNEKIELLRAKIAEELAGKLTRDEFKKLREQYLSTKAGEIPNLMKEMSFVER